jgi:hypothetical protein
MKNKTGSVVALTCILATTFALPSGAQNQPQAKPAPSLEEIEKALQEKKARAAAKAKAESERQWAIRLAEQKEADAREASRLAQARQAEQSRQTAYRQQCSSSCQSTLNACSSRASSRKENCERRAEASRPRMSSVIGGAIGSYGTCKADYSVCNGMSNRNACVQQVYRESSDCLERENQRQQEKLRDAQDSTDGALEQCRDNGDREDRQCDGAYRSCVSSC